MSEIEITASSGNVYRDIELKNPEIRRLKASLSIALAEYVCASERSPAEISAALDATEEQISDLLAYRNPQLELEKMLEMLEPAGLCIIVCPSPPKNKS